ncbi:MAG: hypothetical protein DRJ60_07670 [Thermoprotei archaeon]|nr:MAG: hypothetical protein DRJ60_07670 [Thermoprotei archaeon]
MRNVNLIDDVLDALVDCKPYLVHWKEIESLIKKLLEESSDILDICSKLENLANKEEDPTLKTDLRILLSKLRSKIKK